MRRKPNIRLKIIPQQTTNPASTNSRSGGSTLIACPKCGKSAGWNSYFKGHICRDGCPAQRAEQKFDEQIAFYRSQVDFWKTACNSWKPAQLLDELHLAADTVTKLLDECEQLQDLWSDAAIRLEDSKKEAGELREKLWHAQDSMAFTRTKDEEILRLGAALELVKRERDNALARLEQVYEI